MTFRRGVGRRSASVSLAVAMVGCSLFVADAPQASPSRNGFRVLEASSRSLAVEVVPWGPGPQDVQRLTSAVMESDLVRRLVGTSRHRLLAIKLLDEPQPDQPPSRFRAVIMNYATGKPVVAEGDVADPASIQVGVSSIRPVPNIEEFRDALAILRAKEPVLAGLIASGVLAPYRAMPPLIGNKGRTLAVGLRPVIPVAKPEIVGVDLIHERVVRYVDGAPATSAAADPCGSPEASQETGKQGEPGQVLIKVRRGSEVLWQFVAIRPTASSGTNGSGVELRYVDFHGKRVIERANAPIVNVEYENATCGPYRDWGWEEGRFQAEGNDTGTGFRECNVVPTTQPESNNDPGDFRGVAVYVSEHEVQLVSEIVAGWYRYTSEWRVSDDGTIRPRFRFGATSNSCTCKPHTHHVYWRIDFAIDGQAGDRVSESDAVITTESRTRRVEGARWQVSDPQTQDAYEMSPGPDDGTADDFGRGDLWFLRSRVEEMDDGHLATEEPEEVPADVNAFLDGEDIDQADVVVWYGAHILHDGSDIGQFALGPDLLPVRW